MPQRRKKIAVKGKAVVHAEGNVVKNVKISQEELERKINEVMIKAALLVESGGSLALFILSSSGDSSKHKVLSNGTGAAEKPAADVKKDTKQTTAADTDLGTARAKVAIAIQSSDNRLYGDGTGQVDCSEFVREVSKKAGDNAFKDITVEELKFAGKGSIIQVKHLEDSQYFSRNLKDAKVGDYIFFADNKEKDGEKAEDRLKDITHTGVISSIYTDGTIHVANATLHGAKKDKKTKQWRGGEKSLRVTPLDTDGAIFRKRDGTGAEYFVGLGRVK